MPSKTRSSSHFLGSESAPGFSSIDSELHYRRTPRQMDRHGSTTPPLEDNNQIYNEEFNASGNGDYPPRRGPAIPTHTRDTSVTSVKSSASDSRDIPRVFGLPLKYVSLVTLAFQNATLAIIMHYSRVSVAPDKVYSAASAVLINEILKGSISFAIAFARMKVPGETTRNYDFLPATPATPVAFPRPSIPFPASTSYIPRLRILFTQIASPDSWKLSIPALLYVLQNNLQYIAVSNLDVPTFQVTNQMKILTTAGFSVLLLRKRLTTWKWAALALLAVGVGVVQIQTSSHSPSGTPAPIELPTEDLAGRGGDLVDPPMTEMHPLTGFLAVSAACFTSGLAGVYFEMVLKGSKADLWVRNVQLSLWSLIPALLPVLMGLMRDGMRLTDMFVNFGGWAWCTVITQVAGGLITALVIKYSDNILKGFATSLSIILSSVASVALFNLEITPPFIAGSAVVLGATWMYNAPEEPKDVQEKGTTGQIRLSREDVPLLNRISVENRKSAEFDPYPIDGAESEDGCNISLVAPIESHEPILGYPHGAGSSTRAGSSHSKKPSMSGRLLEKVSSMVGSSGTNPSGNQYPGDEKGKGDL